MNLVTYSNVREYLQPFCNSELLICLKYLTRRPGGINSIEPSKQVLGNVPIVIAYDYANRDGVMSGQWKNTVNYLYFSLGYCLDWIESVAGTLAALCFRFVRTSNTP